MNDSYLDTIRKQQEELRLVSCILNNLADAFIMTGNEFMYDKLKYLSDKTFTSQKEIGDAVARELNRSIKQSQQNSKNMIEGILASRGIHNENHN